jgi:hypothetical protein
MKLRMLASGSAFGLLLFAASAHAQYNVLWWDSTPEYGGQALDAYRKAMSDHLTAFNAGTVFNSTYISSEVQGTLAAHLASNSYDVIVFDATSWNAKFNADDLTAVQNFYATGRNNLVLDGTLYIRSIDYNATSLYPGINGASGGLTVNEVHSIASRGGGIMIGTDHDGFQTDANQVLQALLSGAAFSGITFPSTDGVFYGTDLLNAIQPIAAVDVFNHWDSIDTQAIAPSGVFTDFLGVSRTLYSQVDVADAPGGGVKLSYISTSWKPGSGRTGVTDPNPGGGHSVPDAAATLSLLGCSLLGLCLTRRKR